VTQQFERLRLLRPQRRTLQTPAGQVSHGFEVLWGHIWASGTLSQIPAQVSVSDGLQLVIADLQLPFLVRNTDCTRHGLKLNAYPEAQRMRAMIVT